MAKKATLKQAANALRQGKSWGGEKMGEVTSRKKAIAARKNGKKNS